jgi:AcrR family transcriptional regulator
MEDARSEVADGLGEAAAEAVDGPARKGSPRRVAGATRNPERTKAAIFEAAKREFSEKGLAGARIDVVARRAGTNKRMIYHYWGDKDALYQAVIEDNYRGIRSAETRLNLSRRKPEEGLRELALFTWHYFLDHPEFISLITTENLHQARYLKKAEDIPEIHSRFRTELEDVLRRGSEAGVFKPGLDPVMVYMTIASLGFFYLANRHTNSTIFKRDLLAPDALARWGEHIAATVVATCRA